MMLSCYLETQIVCLTYDIKTENIYGNFYKDKDLFDFSNHPKDSKFFYHSDMKQIAKIKNDSEGEIIIEFVGLKSKNVFFN